jgi:hypothetical protein
MTVEGASPHLLEELLQEFEAALRAGGVPVDQFLRPGATRGAVELEFQQHGLVAPEEAVVWFGWHDGRFDVPGAAEALPVFGAWSLADLAVERVTPGWLPPTGFGEFDWNPNWVHIMGDQTGLAVCCADGPKNPPLVRVIDSDPFAGTQESQTEMQVVSLCTPVAWWIDSIRRGWYKWDPSLSYWVRDLKAQPLLRSIYGMT